MRPPIRLTAHLYDCLKSCVLEAPQVPEFYDGWSEARWLAESGSSVQDLHALTKALPSYRDLVAVVGGQQVARPQIESVVRVEGFIWNLYVSDEQRDLIVYALTQLVHYMHPEVLRVRTVVEFVEIEIIVRLFLAQRSGAGADPDLPLGWPVRDGAQPSVSAVSLSEWESDLACLFAREVVQLMPTWPQMSEQRWLEETGWPLSALHDVADLLDAEGSGRPDASIEPTRTEPGPRRVMPLSDPQRDLVVYALILLRANSDIKNRPARLDQLKTLDELIELLGPQREFNLEGTDVVFHFRATRDYEA